jgi:hypothetical protein
MHGSSWRRVRGSGGFGAVQLVVLAVMVVACEPFMWVLLRAPVVFVEQHPRARLTAG